MTYAELVAKLQEAIPKDAPFIGQDDLKVLVARLTNTPGAWPTYGLIRRNYARMVPGSAGVYLVTEDAVTDAGEVPGTGTPIIGRDV